MGGKVHYITLTESISELAKENLLLGEEYGGERRDGKEMK